jgi:hypothetical protein
LVAGPDARRYGARVAGLIAQAVSRESPVTHRAVTSNDVTIHTELRAVFADYLKVEMRRLRQLVGPDLDLWGYA